MEAADILEKEGRKIRVVSMPSMELFEMRSEEYKNKILPNNIRKRISVEALSDFGWYKYIGLDEKRSGSISTCRGSVTPSCPALTHRRIMWTKSQNGSFQKIQSTDSVVADGSLR